MAASQQEEMPIGLISVTELGRGFFDGSLQDHDLLAFLVQGILPGLGKAHSDSLWSQPAAAGRVGPCSVAPAAAMAIPPHTMNWNKFDPLANAVVAPHAFMLKGVRPVSDQNEVWSPCTSSTAYGVFLPLMNDVLPVCQENQNLYLRRQRKEMSWYGAVRTKMVGQPGPSLDWESQSDFVTVSTLHEYDMFVWLKHV